MLLLLTNLHVESMLTVTIATSMAESEYLQREKISNQDQEDKQALIDKLM
jgi:hypothetical protein